jgi:hypothetical protein
VVSSFPKYAVSGVIPAQRGVRAPRILESEVARQSAASVNIRVVRHYDVTYILTRRDTFGRCRTDRSCGLRSQTISLVLNPRQNKF